MNRKILIYQVLPRLFGNRNTTRKPHGTLAENGAGKFNDFDTERLRAIRDMGFTHVWYTGIIRHATTTDYTRYGIPAQHPSVVKGKAGSPYAIVDYYDVDPDLAVDVIERMGEFEQLVQRTHDTGLKVIIDFVPNHVAREYHSICRPANVRDLGEDDDVNMQFSPQNNFYYCPGQFFQGPVATAKGDEPYSEYPAKATGNDRFDNSPSTGDWYETVKLNYGVDYCDAGGRSYHFDPVPNTWGKMTDILLYWAEKGIDGFRCDMAEMVPPEFWAYAIPIVKYRFPKLIFIAEVYDTERYRSYVRAGFDYLYDKVGLYDCLRDVICDRRPASSITYYWQQVDDIKDHMLYFLENHDEQRIGSDFFCGHPERAIPAVMTGALMQRNPFMVYAGQELGERGMDEEGFSGRDGRTTIFDYWCVDSLRRAFFDRDHLTTEEKRLQLKYQQILRIANRERAVSQGEFFDLMYVNPQSWKFDPRHHFAFLRKKDDEVLLVVCNFGKERTNVGVVIPGHAFDFLGLPEKSVQAVDLLSGEELTFTLQRDGTVNFDLRPYSGRIFKMSIKTNETRLLINDHNKDEFPPAHTAEHLLNQVMIRMFGCERSHNAHVERKKSKITYILDHKPDHKQEREIERQMNELIEADLPVTSEYVDRYNIPEGVKLDMLPKDAGELIRLVHIGDFDVCPCVGRHVRSTAQIGKFILLGTNWNEQKHAFRIRYKVVQRPFSSNKDNDK
ncbi:MAG: alpha-amylase family glycosyl hydrolase [Prevotella sp.]|jgi:glycosidase